MNLLKRHDKLESNDKKKKLVSEKKTELSLVNKCKMLKD